MLICSLHDPPLPQGALEHSRISSANTCNTIALSEYVMRCNLTCLKVDLPKHSAPVYPAPHVQVYMFSMLLQVALLWQGTLAHSSMSTDKHNSINYSSFNVYISHTVTMSSSPAASTRTRVHVHQIDACGSISTRPTLTFIDID